ncbi:Caltractin [Durusdinium trenchii]|uniref:Caltractin n=1 Tax=Durusdinium trenchii TaxID=1381693 RepID=A0ABP0NRS4_9DINO
MLEVQISHGQDDASLQEAELLPGEGSVATRLPRVRAAGRLREDATHEAILQSAALATQAAHDLETDPEVATEGGRSAQDSQKLRLPPRRQPIEGLEVSEKALECIAVCTGAQPRALPGVPYVVEQLGGQSGRAWSGGQWQGSVASCGR